MISFTKKPILIIAMLLISLVFVFYILIPTLKLNNFKQTTLNNIKKLYPNVQLNEFKDGDCYIDGKSSCPRSTLIIPANTPDPDIRTIFPNSTYDTTNGLYHLEAKNNLKLYTTSQIIESQKIVSFLFHIS